MVVDESKWNSNIFGHHIGNAERNFPWKTWIQSYSSPRSSDLEPGDILPDHIATYNNSFVFYILQYRRNCTCGGIKFSHPQFYMSLQLILFLQILLVSRCSWPVWLPVYNVYKDDKKLDGNRNGQKECLKTVIKCISYNGIGYWLKYPQNGVWRK